MPVSLPHIRIFLSSPGDVAEERSLALQVIEHLPHRPAFRDRVTLGPVAWEKPGAGTPMLATMTPQEAINQGLLKPSECDIVVVIFWSRMGTPLPEEYKKPDGSRFWSGTEWEFWDAFNSAKATDRPFLVVYRRAEEPVIGLGDPNRAEKTEQWDRVEAFFASFVNPDSSIKQGHNIYEKPEDFQQHFESHLETLVLRLLEELETPQELELPEPEPIETESPVQEPQQVIETRPPEAKDGASAETPDDLSTDPVKLLTQKYDGLISFEDWYNLAELYANTIEYQMDSSRRAFIDQFASPKRSSEDVKGIRLLGQCGVGKTRLALEAIRSSGLQRTTIYVFSPADIPASLFSDIAKEASNEEITVVVDNCDYQDVQRIWQYAQPYKKSIQLITIETVPVLHATLANEQAFYLQPLLHGEISKIVSQVYEINQVQGFNDDKRAYADDFERIDLKRLIEFVNSFLCNPDISGAAELTNLEKLSSLIERSIPKDYRSLRVLQGLSLIDGIGLEANVRWQGEKIAEFMGIPFSEFKLISSNLQNLGLVKETGWPNRGVHHRFVVSRLVAVYSAAMVWRALGEDILHNFLMAEGQSNEAKYFRNALLNRLGDLGDRNIALPIVRQLLTRFQSFDDLVEDPELYALLGTAEPLSAAHHLRQLMQDVSHDRLLEFKKRRSIVTMLQSLVRLKETFYNAAYMLARLASAENESWGNNATGVWKSIFFIRFGGNPAIPSERDSLLEEVLNDTSVEMKLIAIEGIGSSLNNHEGGAITRGPGGYLTPSSWYPETWKEFWDVRRATLRLLDKAMNDSTEEVANAARKCLLEFARHQIPVLTDEIISRLKSFPKTDSYKLEIWKTLQLILKYDAEHLDQEDQEKIRQLAEDTITDSYHDRLLVYVANSDLTLIEGGDNRQQARDLQAEKIHSLVEEGYQNPISLEKELVWLTSQSAQFHSPAGQFLRQIGHLDRDHAWWSQLLQHSLTNKNWTAVEAYLDGRLDVDDFDWVRNQVEELGRDFQDLIAVVLNLLSRTHSSSEIVAITQELLAKDWITLADISWRQHWAERLKKDDLSSFLISILEEDDDATVTGLSFLSGRLQKYPEEGSQFADLALAFLLRPTNQIGNYLVWENWRFLADVYVADHPVEVGKAVLAALELRATYYHEDHEIWELLKSIFEYAPAEIWQLLGSRLLLEHTDPESLGTYALRHLPVNSLAPVSNLMKWAKDNLPIGPRILTDLCFVGGSNLNELARELIIHYAEDDMHVKEVLYANFVYPGGSAPVYEGRYAELRSQAMNWLNDPHVSVRRWAQWVIDELSLEIAKEGIEGVW